MILITPVFSIAAVINDHKLATENNTFIILQSCSSESGFRSYRAKIKVRWQGCIHFWRSENLFCYFFHLLKAVLNSFSLEPVSSIFKTSSGMSGSPSYHFELISLSHFFP